MRPDEGIVSSFPEGHRERSGVAANKSQWLVSLPRDCVNITCPFKVITYEHSNVFIGTALLERDVGTEYSVAIRLQVCLNHLSGLNDISQVCSHFYKASI